MVENTITADGDGGRLLKARTVYMVSKARLADMQLKRLTGELLPAAEVKVAAFNAARRIRDHCLVIPSRCSGAIAAEVRRAMETSGGMAINLAEVENILAAEIRTVLSSLTDDLGQKGTYENETSKTG